MRKNILPPIVAVVGGIVGFALRKWDLSIGFEANTGLAVPEAISTVLLFLWSVLVAVGVLAAVWKRGEEKDGLALLSGGARNTVYLTAVLVSAVLLLVSAGLEVLTFTVNNQTSVAADTALTRSAKLLLPPLRIILCVGGLFSAGIWGKNVYRGTKGRGESLALLELCVLFCVWLVSDYQVRAADPVIRDYVYEVFAIVTAVLGLYYLAGISFGEPKPRRTLFFGLMGVYFCLVTLADNHTLTDAFRYGFAVIFLAAHAVVLLNPGSEEETKMESDNDG